MEHDSIINTIINSFVNFNIRDIKLISDQDTVIASFILCSCLIEQIAGFRYAKMKQRTGKEMFEQFVKDYLNNYDASKLRNDLRNKLVHNYSVGETYALTMHNPEIHLSKRARDEKVILNLENFINDLDKALKTYVRQLQNNPEIRKNALDWYKQHQIIEMLPED